MSLRYKYLELETGISQNLGHGCNCPKKIHYLKNAKDKEKSTYEKEEEGRKPTRHSSK